MALLISGTEGAWYQVFETGVFDMFWRAKAAPNEAASSPEGSVFLLANQRSGSLTLQHDSYAGNFAASTSHF